MAEGHAISLQLNDSPQHSINSRIQPRITPERCMTGFQDEYYWQSSTNATELSSTRTVPLITSALSLAAKCIGEYIGVLFENIFIIFMEIRSNRYSRLLDSGLFVSVNLIGALLSVRVRNRSIKERNKIIPGGFNDKTMIINSIGRAESARIW
eukprot:46459_1